MNKDLKDCMVVFDTKLQNTPAQSTSKYDDFGPLINMDDVQTAESTAKANELYRRLVAITLTKSRTDLAKGFQSNPDAILELIENLQAYQGYLNAGIEMTEAAIARLLVAAQDIIGEVE